MSLSQWASEKLYLDNDDLVSDFIQEIETAKISIDMEVFTFEDGVFARRLLEAFKKAIERGVQVRLVADGWGSPTFWETIGPELEKIGVGIRIHRSLPWRHHRHNLDEPRSRIAKFIVRLRRINRGFHRKITVIDKKSAWVTSLNVTDVHLKEVYGKNAWSDVGVRFTGPGIATFIYAFDKIFLRGQWVKFSSQPKSPLILLNNSFFRRRKTTFIQKRRLKRAQKRIWIQTPYFIPERTLLRALYRAARKNIDIKIIIPEKNDQPIVKFLTYALLNQLIHHKIQVYEYQPRFAHKKVLIVDDIYTLGSTNFNHRSFLHDLEVEVLLSHSNTKEQVELSFLDDLKECLEITPQWIKKKPIWYRMTARILFFFRFWC